MAKKKTRARPSASEIESLKHYVRQNAKQFLAKPNINSVGIGYKISDGKRTNDLSIQFTVDRKVGLESLESLGTTEIPKTLVVDGIEYPTDVLERSYEKSARAVSVQAQLEEAQDRKSFIDPVVPGVSIGHPTISAGTAGCVVYDATTGGPLLLSNWHVLQGNEGVIGDPVVQPGRHDDNRIQQNVVGALIRSHLGVAGDCAVAEISRRGLAGEVVGLDVAIDEIGEPDLGDKVVKSGRTTGVTHGIVVRIHVTAQIDYGERFNPNVVEIGCFEIEPDPDFPADRGEISMGGDSGSAWIAKSSAGPTTMMVGLHFAGEIGDAPEQALACYPASVFEKLGILPRPVEVVEPELVRRGFSTSFVGGNVFFPKPLTPAVTDDLLVVDEETVFHYTHFSLAMSKTRKLARWVAWNIDGSSLKALSRNGISFQKDHQLPLDAQHGNELYRNNPLDRGHIARRADLNWGPLPEAQQANVDSFFYTNIAPQHQDFNQSRAGGIWGELENAVFADVNIEDLKVSLLGGPIFSADDPIHRGVQLPQSFWKAVYYREAGQVTVRVRAYVLTQADLLNELEVLELPEFAVFEVSVSELQDLTGLDILNARPPRRSRTGVESISADGGIRRVQSVADII